MMRIYPASAFPDTQPREQQKHSCGRCRTPWGVTNPWCPARETEEARRNG